MIKHFNSVNTMKSARKLHLSFDLSHHWSFFLCKIWIWKVPYCKLWTWSCFA